MQHQESKTNSRIGKVSISNRAGLSSSQPIPFENAGALSYLEDTKYIPFLASSANSDEEDTNYTDNYDQYGTLLLKARLTSTTHNACITTKKDYCAGNGFRHKAATEADPKLPPDFIEWIGNLNLNNDPATEINKKAFESHFTFGNTPIELVRFDVLGKRHFFVYVHNFLKWRLLAPVNDIVRGAITSPLFMRNSRYITDADLEKAKQLPLYNPRNSERENWKKFSDGTERTMIWYKHSISAFEYYGLPSAVSSMIYQVLEYKGARSNLDDFENNMVVPAILALKGNLSEAEASRIAKQIINTHTGDGKRGRTMVLASEEGIEKSDFHTMDTTKDGSYINADAMWTQKIIQANQWDAILAGIVSPSSLGKGSGFLTKIKEHINNTVITPAQQDIQGKVWVHIFRLAKEWMGFDINENEIEIANTIDISGLTDIDITTAVQVNEARTAKGLPEDPKMKGVYMNAAKATQEQAPTTEKGGQDVQL